MVSIIPELDEEGKVFSSYQPTKEEEKRARRVHPRMQEMLDAREPYMPAMRRALLNYEGISRENPDDPRDEKIVMPLARIFVEAKTAEEVKATNEYIFDAIEGKEWIGKLMGDVNKHAGRKTSLAAKRIQMKRMKNLAGVSIGRVGYRKIMRTIKERVEGDDDAIAYEWREREVPIYDDLFVDIVSPFDFAIDPNARTLNDAMDCVHFHTENYEVFLEAYSKDERFYNIDSVEPGKGIVFSNEGPMRVNQTASKNMVGIAEYFNCIRDEWIIYANGVEIYCGPLPDDHKMLPFFSYHNDPCFVTSLVPPEGRSPNSGKELAAQENITAHESFWTKGDPETIRDLIDLYTGFSRAMFRNVKLSGETIVATAPGARFDDKRNWRTGDQAVGMMNKFQVVSLANSTAGNFEAMLESLFEAIILATGIDPRSLADGKQKTATETAVQRETSMNRLQQNIDFNNENGEIRLGTLMYKCQVQYYSKPEIVVLTGQESDADLEDFHDVERNPETGKPEYGRRYRRIKTSVRMREKRRKVKDGYKYYLSESEEGVQSFLARPEYIRGAEVDVRISNDRKLGQIQAIQIEQAKDALNTAAALVPLAQPSPDGMTPPLVAKEEMPNIGFFVKQYVKAMGHNPEEAMGSGKTVSKTEQEEKAVMDQYMATPIDINPPPMVASQPMPDEDL